MDYLIIEGVPPYDGRWQFDLETQELTTREWGWIKRLSGYLPLTVEEGLGDPELVVVFACIALRRAGKATPTEVPKLFEELSDAPFGSAITMETDVVDEAEDDAGPPASSSSENGDSSGATSTPSSETSVPPPSLSGTPDSDTSGLFPTLSATSPQAS
jgi:hypothetical protein